MQDYDTAADTADTAAADADEVRIRAAFCLFVCLAVIVLYKINRRRLVVVVVQ